MGRVKYGSKAEYERARASIREQNALYEKELFMTDAERTQARNRDRLEEDAMMHHIMFMAAAQSLDLLKARFT